MVAALTAITFVGFTFFAESKAEVAEHEEKEESVDFDNIPLSEKQVKAVDIRMGEAKDIRMDAMLQASGSLVLRAQNVGDVSSLMGGIVKSILVKEGQQVRRGQMVATVENTEVVSLQREYYSAYREGELARLEYERQKMLASSGAGVKKNLQVAEKNYRKSGRER